MYFKSTLNRFKTVRLLAAGMALVGALLSTNASAQCTPTSINSKCCNIGTASVTLGSMITNTTAWSQAVNYYDNFNTDIACPLTEGQGYYLTIGTTAGFNNQAVCAWVDWNRNNTFDAGEKFMSSTNVTAGQSYSDSLHVPANQASGAYRLRVLVDYYWYYANGGASFDPCTKYYGDFQDYQLIVVTQSGTDVAASSLIAPVVLSLGDNDVTFSFRNVSNDTIDSVRVGYQISGGSAVNEAIDLLAGGNSLLPCAVAYNHTFATKLNISTGGNYTLKLWVNYANGSNPDADNSNDTISVTVCTGLAGNFTIDGSQSTGGTNYTSFTDAVTALNNCGISDDVTFTVAAGTYTEKVALKAVTGSSDTNTITFNGVDSTRVITYNAGSTFMLDGADYVIIKNLAIETSGSGTTSVGLHLTNGADWNYIDHCWLTSTTKNYPAFAFGIMGAQYYTGGNWGNNNTVTNCALSGGYMTSVIMGDYNTNAHGNSVLGSAFTNPGYYCMYTYYQDTLMVKRNLMDGSTGAFTYGVAGGYVSNSEFSSNTIYASYSGIQIYNFNGTNLSLVNNAISGDNMDYGIYLYYTNGAYIYHNSVYTTSTAANCYAFYGYNITSIDMRNNIFAATGGGTGAYAMYHNNSTGFSLCDYNDFYAPGSGKFVYMGADYATKAALKGQNGFNNNIYSQAANFVNNSTVPYDLHLTTTVAAISGDGTVGVTKDIDGDTRCTFAPTLGADESKFPVPMPVSNFTMPDTYYVNSPLTLLNSAGANDGKAFEWYDDGNSSIYSQARNTSITFTTTGLHCMKLNTINCSGAHDTTKCVHIITPPTSPVVDFIADKNVIESGEDVNFTDLSTVGPVEWSWAIYPGQNTLEWTYGNGTDSTFQNPQVNFVAPGKYTVTLYAKNSQGTSSLVKTAYIEVVPVETMCGANSFTNLPTGKFYDDGGKSGSYAANQTCSFLFDPCGSDVTLTFSKFETGTFNTSLKVYDGKDASGTPLFNGAGFFGTSIPGPFVGKSGKLYLEWKSGPAWLGQFNGWEAEWTSTPKQFSKPSAAYTANSNAVQGGTHKFTANTNDKSYDYQWDVDGDGFIDSYSSTCSFVYTATGTYTACLYVVNCGGMDTVCKTITVNGPTAAPTVDFKVDYQNNLTGGACQLAKTNSSSVEVGDTVVLTDLSTEGPNSWGWAISPANDVVWVGANTDQNPLVIFTKAQNYDIQLDATNSIGTGTLTRTNAVKAIAAYCTPSVSNLVPDLGISSVKIGSIDQGIGAGTEEYTNLSLTVSACLNKGAKYPFTISRPTSKNPINRKIWIDWNQDGDFADAGEMVKSHGSSAAKDWMDTVTVPANATKGATRMRIATSFGNGSNTACGPNQFGQFVDFRLYITDDVTPPVITLNGSPVINLSKCQNYVDASATAWDAVDGFVSVTVTGSVNTTSIGSYTITYNAVDAAGNNAAPVTRTVNVVADNVGPVITLNQGSPYYVNIGSTYSEPGATAYDSCDGNISTINTTGSVNGNAAGTYTITYTAMDNSGNTGTATRTVIVKDVLAPVITLNGSDTVTVSVFSTYTDLGATAVDNSTANVTVTASGTVNTSVLGIYYVTYSSTDADGNTGTKVRVVKVVDATAPVITLYGGSSIDVEGSSTLSWTELGASSNDNYWPNMTVTITGSVDMSTLGTYTLTYTSTDGSGNVGTTTRTIKIVKKVPPMVTLNGAVSPHILRWHAYTEAGVTITDHFYSPAALQSLLSTVGTVNILVAGAYQLDYSVTDGSGNKSNTVSRVVTVDENVGMNIPENESVVLYPNPTSGVVNIITNVSDVKAISIINSLGQTVRTIANTSAGKNLQVDLSGYASGIYLISIQTKDQNIVKKVKLSNN
jgi:PKD repeat protein